VGDTIVISEREFVMNFTAFWHELLPMSEEYVRTCNQSYERFSKPLRSNNPADGRGLVNEIGFRLFASSLRHSDFVGNLSRDAVVQSVEEARDFIYLLRERSRTAPRLPSSLELDEAMVIAKRLEDFFSAEHALTGLEAFPLFPGCGVVDECAGDVLGGDTLFEIKAGDRNYRGIDFRQMLTYLALNRESGKYDIGQICLVNPRLGTFVFESVDGLCEELSGRGALEVLDDIVQFISDPPDRYGAIWV
jgi:hypothetical protein